MFTPYCKGSLYATDERKDDNMRSDDNDDTEDDGRRDDDSDDVQHDDEGVGAIPFDGRDGGYRCEGEKPSDHAPATVFPAGTAQDAPTPPPTDLLDTGRALWRDVTAKYELRADEVPLLAEMCRAVDRLAGIRAALVGQPLLVAGSTGQQRAHPLLGEERATVLVLAKLQAQLGLPDEVGQVGATPASRKAQRAANERWRREAVVLDGQNA